MGLLSLSAETVMVSEQNLGHHFEPDCVVADGARLFSACDCAYPWATNRY